MKMFAEFNDASAPDRFAPPNEAGASAAGISVAVALSDGFSMVSLGSITDALSLAEHGSRGVRPVRTTLFSFARGQVRSRSGIRVAPDHALSDAFTEARFVRRFDALFVLTGENLTGPEESTVLRLVRSAGLHGRPVCLTGAAIRKAAESGSISRCTDHWTRIAVLGETAPSVSVINAIFTRDGHVVSSPGELATLDYVIHLIRGTLGVDVANEVSSHLLLDAVRTGTRRQPCLAADRYRGIPDILAQAIDRIETDIEQPPTPTEIAAGVGISVRQLERLFRKFIGRSPQRYCRHIQLEHAQKLLEKSSMDITEISLACGFREATTFNKHFKRVFGVSPGHFRRFGLRAERLKGP